MNKTSSADELTLQNPATGLVFLVDADIPYANMLFEDLGRVELFNRSDPLQRLDVLEIADVLAVRSSTRVGAELLAGCRNLKILATPVVGTDHIDFRAVSAASARTGREIRVINAAGSTADAVADWTVGAMAKVLGRLPRSVGIVGAGNCGTAVAKRLDMLGVKYLFNDPPKAAGCSTEAAQAVRSEAGDKVFKSAPLDDIARCEVITFHVPLTTPAQSAWPTADMISADFATKARASGCSLIVNCARGGILDESMASLSPDIRPHLAVDVFKNEPSPSVDFVRACVLATPHIAGSGRIGRMNAATMIRRRVCEILGIGPAALPTAANHFPTRPEINATNFLNQIEGLSGVTLSDEFKHAWLTSNPHERPILFNTFRALGIRTEPIWVELT